jgi:hypothetical protein
MYDVRCNALIIKSLKNEIRTYLSQFTQKVSIILRGPFLN